MCQEVQKCQASQRACRWEYQWVYCIKSSLKIPLLGKVPKTWLITNKNLELWRVEKKIGQLYLTTLYTATYLRWTPAITLQCLNIQRALQSWLNHKRIILLWFQAFQLDHSSLFNALDLDHFSLHFQPQIESSSDRFTAKGRESQTICTADSSDKEREEEGGAAHFVLFSKVALTKRERQGNEPNAETSKRLGLRNRQSRLFSRYRAIHIQ